MRTLSNTVTKSQMVYAIREQTRPLREKIQQHQKENEKLRDVLRKCLMATTLDEVEELCLAELDKE